MEDVFARIIIKQGDITKEQADAIVNAANSSLLGGGGVDGAIHRAAGPQLLSECATLGGCPAGEAKTTKGYRLPAKFVIHTVGPNRNVGQVEPRTLASAFSESLDAAVAVGAETVAFPAISAGVYGWDVREVAQVAADVIAQDRWPSIREVRFVLFNDEASAAFSEAFGLEVKKYQ